jgi:hypothetical protein
MPDHDAFYLRKREPMTSSKPTLPSFAYEPSLVILGVFLFLVGFVLMVVKLFEEGKHYLAAGSILALGTMLLFLLLARYVKLENEA